MLHFIFYDKLYNYESNNMHTQCMNVFGIDLLRNRRMKSQKNVTLIYNNGC